MALAFVAVVCCIELLLMAGSRTARSRMEKVRSSARILLFALFCMLLLTSVIQWNFRWYGMAILLFVWAVFGVFRLFEQRGNEGEFQPRRGIFRASRVMLLALISVTPALIFPPYEPLPPSGADEVTIARLTYTDGSRVEQFSDCGEYRRVNLTCWYPQNDDSDETYPLILFSHGGLGTETSNESLYLELASHGYVVCSIGHPYHAFWTTSEDGRVTFVSMEYFQELQQEDAKRNKEQSYRYYQKWMQTRTSDINLVMDAILETASNGADGIYGLIDVERLGVMGHSLGGSAALALPRQRDDIDAVVALESPYLYDIVGVEDNEFLFTNEPYPVPVLNVYSEASWSHLSEWAQYARNYELLSRPQTTVNNLHLSGAGHFYLTDLPLASPLLVRSLEGGESTQDSAEYLKDLNKACLEFFDRYLKRQGEHAQFSP